MVKMTELLSRAGVEHSEWVVSWGGCIPCQDPQAWVPAVCCWLQFPAHRSPEKHRPVTQAFGSLVCVGLESQSSGFSPAQAGGSADILDVHGSSHLGVRPVLTLCLMYYISFCGLESSTQAFSLCPRDEQAPDTLWGSLDFCFSLSLQYNICVL